MKKVILSLVVFLLIKSNVFPMFVVGKQSTEGFIGLEEDNKELQSRVYETLMTYQYPMNLILPEGDYETLFTPITNGEQDFLRSKLQEISPDLDIAYISTTLWELYALDIIENEQNIKEIHPQLIKDKMIDPSATRAVVHARYHQTNFIPEIKDLYLKINNIIIKNLNAPSQKSFENDLKDQSILICHRLIKEKARVSRDLLLDPETSFLDKIIFSETAPNPEDKIWLYRVTSLLKTPYPIYADGVAPSDLQEVSPLIDDVIKDWVKKKQHCLSFGGSIFASIINDHGACVFSYIVDSPDNTDDEPHPHNSRFLYRISLQKNEARQHNDSSHFVIHPINLLVHLLSKGLHYHVWTKKMDDSSLDDTFYSNILEYANAGGCDYSKLSIKSGRLLELNRDVSTLLSKSELFSVNGKVPSDENLNFWETLKSHQTKHSELLHESLEKQNNLLQATLNNQDDWELFSGWKLW